MDLFYKVNVIKQTAVLNNEFGSVSYLCWYKAKGRGTCSMTVVPIFLFGIVILPTFEKSAFYLDSNTIYGRQCEMYLPQSHNTVVVLNCFSKEIFAIKW